MDSLEARRRDAAERKRLERERKAAGEVVIPPLPATLDHADELIDYAVELGLVKEIEAETNRSFAIASGAAAALDDWIKTRWAKRKGAPR